MKISLLIIPFLIALNALGQNRIITLDNKEITCEIIKTKDAKVICKIDGKKVSYSAKEIIGYVRNGYKYDSGRARYNAFGFKKWHFIYKIIEGKLNVYRHKVKAAKTNSGSIASPSNSVSISGYYFYFRQTNKPRSVMVRPHMIGWRSSMRKILADSPEALRVLEETAWDSGDWRPMVKAYNDPVNVELYISQIKRRAKKK